MYKSFASLGRFIPRYLILFDAVVNGIGLLISLSDTSQASITDEHKRKNLHKILGNQIQQYIKKTVCRASLVAQQQRFHLECRKCGFDPWIGKIPQRRKGQPTPVFFPGKTHGQRNLATVHLVPRVRLRD